MPAVLVTHIVIVTHIGTYEFGLGTKLLELSRQFLALLIASSGNNDTGAFTSETQGRGASNTSQCASDQNNGRSSVPPFLGM
jgi:hypothetical protein